MVANILPEDPLLLDDGDLGQKVKIQLFSEHGHDVYQSKGNDECSNI